MFVLSPNKIANYLSKEAVIHSDINKKKRDQIRYGLEWGISGFYQILLTLLIGASLGVFFETCLSLLVISSLRVFSGGAHFSKYNHCLIASIILVVSIAATSSYILTLIPNLHGVYYWTYPLFTLIILLYAPALFKKKDVMSKDRIKKVKIISLFIAISFMTLSFLISSKYSIVIWQSLCYQIITLTPLGIKVIHFIDSSINNRGK